MTDDPEEPEFSIEVDARVVEGGPPRPRIYVDEDIQGGRFEPTPETTVFFDHVRVDQVDFSGVRLSDFEADGCHFTKADFSQFKPRGGGFGYLDTSTYVDCGFDGADLRLVRPGRARFERCLFTNVRIYDWFTDADFIDCIFSGRLEQTTFVGPLEAWMAKNRGHRPIEFRGNDFSAADLMDTSFRWGFDLAAQILPGPPDYVLFDQWPARVDRARDLVRRQPPSREREKSLKLLEIFASEGYRTQSANLLHRDEIRPDVLSTLETALPSPLH